MTWHITVSSSDPECIIRKIQDYSDSALANHTIEPDLQEVHATNKEKTSNILLLFFLLWFEQRFEETLLVNRLHFKNSQDQIASN